MSEIVILVVQTLAQVFQGVAALLMAGLLVAASLGWVHMSFTLTLASN